MESFVYAHVICFKVLVINNYFADVQLLYRYALLRMHQTLHKIITMIHYLNVNLILITLKESLNCPLSPPPPPPPPFFSFLREKSGREGERERKKERASERERERQKKRERERE